MCSSALIARVVSCSDFRLASHVSHSRTERHLSLASQAQHAVAADVVQIWHLQELTWSTSTPRHRRERAYAGSSNMKVDRIGTHSPTQNSYVCTRGASACDISRTDSTHVDARLLCEPRRLPRWVGVCWKCMETSIGSSRSMYLLVTGNPFSQAVEAYREDRDSGEGAMCKVPLHTVQAPFVNVGALSGRGR